MKHKISFIISIIIGVVVTITTWAFISQGNKMMWSMPIIGQLAPVIAGFVAGGITSYISKKNDMLAATIVGIILTAPMIMFLVQNGFSHNGRNVFLWYWPIYLLPATILGAYVVKMIFNRDDTAQPD